MLTCCGKSGSPLHFLNSQWVCQKKKIFLWKHFTGNEKRNLSDGVMTMQRIMCHPKTLISQHYSCFPHGKSTLSGFENYVAFPFLEIPVGQCDSISCTFHHSSCTLQDEWYMFCFLFYFISHLNVFQLQNNNNKPNLSTAQRFSSVQMFPSDDVTKASNTESVPPEWGPTPNIIVNASPIPC